MHEYIPFVTGRYIPSGSIQMVEYRVHPIPAPYKHTSKREKKMDKRYPFDCSVGVGGTNGKITVHARTSS